jgi:hypothetical protein
MFRQASRLTAGFDPRFAADEAMTSTIHENASPYRAYTPALESGDVLAGDEYWRR